MKFTNVVLMSALSVLSLASSEDSETLLYSGTKICSKHKTTMCLSYDYDDELVVLDKRHKLKFDIETIERINMQLNRVYTYAKDPSTKKKVKSCLIKKNIDGYGVTGVGLAPCDVDDNELVLAVESGLDTSIDEFVLKQIGESAEALCLTTTHTENGELVPSQRKSQLKRHSPIVLDTCESEYAQEFKARSYDASSSSRMISTEAPEVEAYIGRYCLSEQPDLCLGVSLQDGTDLVNDVFMQVKNYTKNEAKNLHDLKMRWYHDLENNRIASAANMSLCIEALYGASVGNNRAGTEIFDDVTHLGSCNPVSRVITVDDPTDLPASEHFYANEVTTATESYLELKTIVPVSAQGNATEKCVSIVKCVVHDSGRCTPYNSVPVYDAEDLQQGAYARLKDCNSKEMVSQRWYYVRDDVVTVPPTNYPTPKPATDSPTPSPTPKPTIATEPLPPTDGDSGSTDNDNTVTKSNGKAGLTAGLALVGVLCFAVIVMGVAYYYKHRNEFQNLPEEDENFIARV